MTATPTIHETAAAFLAPTVHVGTRERVFAFIGERLWLDFVNSDSARSPDALRDFETLMSWMEAATIVDGERGQGMRRRAREQPSGAAAALVDARRVRGSLRGEMKALSTKRVATTEDVPGSHGPVTAG